MSQTVSRPSTSGKPGPDAPTQPDVLDLWLKRELARMYKGVLREPVPDELLQLIAAS